MTKRLSEMTEAERVVRQRQNRERYAAEKAARLAAQQQSLGTVIEPSEEFRVDMAIPENEDVTRPQPSLKERVLNRLNPPKEEDEKKPAPKTTGEKKHMEKAYSLISNVLPLTLSGIIALYSERLFSDAFKACAPSKDEVSTILLPIFSVIARHVEVEGKATQDAIDLGSALLGAIVVSTRMLMTAEEIRRSQHVGQNIQNDTSNLVNFRGTTSANSQAENIAGTGPNTGTNAIDQFWGSGNVSPNGNGNAASGDTESRAGEAAKVAALLRKDTQGRRQMGLAPRILREGD